MTLATLVELLALKAPPARPGHPIIEDKKLPAQQKVCDECWYTLLQTLMASQPQLIEEAMLRLSTQAQAVVNGYLSVSPELAFESTYSNDLPEILASPLW